MKRQLTRAFNACLTIAATIALVTHFTAASAKTTEIKNTNSHASLISKQRLIIKEPQTELSTHISGLQSRFDKVYEGKRRIIVLDPDWFKLNAALNTYGDGKYFINDYLLSSYLERYQLQVAQSHIKAVADRFSVPGTQAFCVKDQDQDICYVSGQTGDIDGSGEIMRWLNVSPEIHGAIASVPLKPEVTEKYSLEIANKYTDYHEIGHCFDRYYMSAEIEGSKSGISMGKIVELRHKSEIFAESFATLLMARDGHTDIAEIRANLRLATMGLTAPVTVKSFNDKYLDYYAPYIYALHYALRGTQEYIEKAGAEIIREMSYEDLAEVAYLMAEEYAIDPDIGSHALTFAPNNKWDISVWDKLRHDFDHIVPRYNLATKIINEINQAIASIFDFAAVNIPAIKLGDIPFDMSGTSAAIKLAKTEEERLENERLPVLADSFYNILRKSNNSEDSIVSLYSETANLLRSRLSNDSIQIRKEAMDDLKILGKAIDQAFRRLKLDRNYTSQAEPVAYTPKESKYGHCMVPRNP
jgi:hypothetical protein